MPTKNLGGKRVIIRKLFKKDLRNAKQFQDFINSFIKEDAQILVNKKVPLEEEVIWLKDVLKKVKNRKTVFLVAKYKDEIIGTSDVNPGRGRKNHIGEFGIVIKNGYRGIGLGSCLMQEIIKLSRKELKPKIKIIRLSVFPANKPAIGLYKKFGFKKVAEIPRQIQYKGKLINEIIMLLEL